MINKNEIHNKISSVSTGAEHLHSLGKVDEKNRKLSESIFCENEELIYVLGMSLSGVYLSSTCSRTCSGGNHIIETLGSRVYNLACGAYSLIKIGLYDESLNLVRSIGEIANLLQLTKKDKAKFEEWMSATKPVRLKHFSPAKVRQLVGENDLVMGEKWYSDLCESYTHITPHTAPNNYDRGSSACGGIVQRDGASFALRQLMHVTLAVALDLCKYSDLDDIYQELQEAVRKYGNS